MAASLYTLALELVALFGFLCILLNVALPLLAFALRVVAVDVPREWRKWQLHRAQQRELRRLQRRVDALTRRKKEEEQETRRRARMASAQKRQQTEATPQQAVDGWLHPIADLAPSEQFDSRTKQKQTATPQQRRHRLSIYSTVKKPASSSARER